MITRTYTISSEYQAEKIFPKKYLFLDIETTGLQKDTTILYLVGCGYYQQNAFQIIQWFNDDGISEPEILQALQKTIEDFIKQSNTQLFTFNGESFDIPYLNRHYELNEMAFRIDCPSFDLYKLLKPFQLIYGMEHGRQKDWEHFLRVEREDRYDGGQLISLYKEYLIKKNPDLLETLLLHNKEDIQGMQALSPLFAYQKLLDGKLSYQDMAYSHKTYALGQGSLVIECMLESPLPKPLQIHSSMGSVNASDHHLKVSLPILEGTLKFFFPDFKNYFYLPEEDRAVHKTVGCYVDKKHREKAKASNCYVNKTSIYLPFPNAFRYYGIEIHSDIYKEELLLYKTKYSDKHSYVEFDQLFEGKFTALSDYLCDWIKAIMIFYLRERD